MRKCSICGTGYQSRILAVTCCGCVPGEPRWRRRGHNLVESVAAMQTTFGVRTAGVMVGTLAALVTTALGLQVWRLITWSHIPVDTYVATILNVAALVLILFVCHVAYSLRKEAAYYDKTDYR